MKLAMEWAEKGRGFTKTNPLVGAILVKEGEIVGRGYHRAFGEDHAEVMALKEAGEKAKGATIYVTLEPCQMCAGAIVQARIPRVVLGAMNPKAGCAGSVLNILQVEAFNHQTEIETGVLQEECSQMMSDFFRELRKKKKEEKGTGVQEK